jgi:catechol 2,3-dioxygenase-like lactoylglutathione lyase family enzyme
LDLQSLGEENRRYSLSRRNKLPKGATNMSSTESAKSPAVGFEGVNPILPVRDLAASLDYYVKTLGFSIDWQGPYFASVSRGKCHLFLSQDDQGHPGAWVWIGVEDADALLAEYRQSGAKIRHLPTNYEWAYEMQVEDLDGNVLRLGSDRKENEPVGEWLDMKGQRWLPQPGGHWKRAE